MLTASHAFAMTIYVSNEKDNTITAVDGKTLRSSRRSRWRVVPAASR